jgi:hypothetical protein
MNENEEEKLSKPYIDAEYYNNIFKPHKNARIQGSFVNADENLVNFEAFINRGSEFIDRLVNNKISNVGGIDYVSPTPQMFIKKATACLVQFWFIQGYTISELDSQLNLGSLNISNKKDASTLRKIIGLDTIILVQKSGL